MKSDLQRLCDRKGVRITAVYGKNKEEPVGFESGCHPWRVTLRFSGRQLTVDFFQGLGHEKEPTAADVLSCLISDATAGEQDFESFCSEFGFDPDSRKAEASWKACAGMVPKLRRFLGSDFNTFGLAEH